jgi:nucleotide-binding universal stress UspA family protein
MASSEYPENGKSGQNAAAGAYGAIERKVAMKISSLLAVTDFSPVADLAIERAAPLVRRYASTLDFLHVVPPISWRMFGAAFSEHPLAMEERMYRKIRPMDSLSAPAA